MDVESAPVQETPRSRFLVRTFVKIGSFHRITLFEDGTLPTTDEQQLFTWKDATLREVLSTLRNTAPHVVEYRHPLARFSFRTVYVEQGSRGRFVSKDLGMVYSRDILGEPGSLNATAPRLLDDSWEPTATHSTDTEREERTLEDLRFVPGDFLLIAVILPKSVTLPSEISIKGAAPSSGNGWRSVKGDSGWGGAGSLPSGPGGFGRGGGGHWRGESNGPSTRGGRGGTDRDHNIDRRVPPPRGAPWGKRGDSRSRSRSPPRRRRD
ncbi:Sin3 associated polypeptide p18-domain-containing protein [Mycena amicta]|nr:Sin3 associated polypeptide p18-domain-containing protein [Mycena amicta]